MQINDNVPFDPGYSQFSAHIPEEVLLFIDQIAAIKQPHQRKFEFQKLYVQVSPFIKNRVAIYLGCILWGAFLYHRFKDEPKKISGNVMKELSEQDNADYFREINFIIELIEKLDKASFYYLKKPSGFKNLIVYPEVYREFVEINNNFKTLNKTDEINLPEAVSHFQNYDNDKLDELKNIIDEIIASEKIDKILDYGFYNN